MENLIFSPSPSRSVPRPGGRGNRGTKRCSYDHQRHVQSRLSGAATSLERCDRDRVIPPDGHDIAVWYIRSPTDPCSSI